MKRFYKDVAVVEADGEGYRVTLDGRPIRTPAKKPLTVPYRALAEAIADEWRAQGETVTPSTMPMTQLANTALDRIPAQREEIVGAVAAYAETDLLCYRAEEPAELAALQTAVWQPLLDWAALRYDAALIVTSGIIPARQPAGACRALRAAVEALDDLTLAAVQNATAACGSIVLALALLEGRIGAEDAFEASELERSFQIDRWGEDEEAALQRRALRQDILVTRQFLDCLRTS